MNQVVLHASTWLHGLVPGLACRHGNSAARCALNPKSAGHVLTIRRLPPVFCAHTSGPHWYHFLPQTQLDNSWVSGKCAHFGTVAPGGETAHGRPTPLVDSWVCRPGALLRYSGPYCTHFGAPGRPTPLVESWVCPPDFGPFWPPIMRGGGGQATVPTLLDGQPHL